MGLRPSCMKVDNQGTIISVKSKCFEKPIKIIVSEEDDDMLEHLNQILDAIKGKKEEIKRRKTLSNINNIEI